MAKKNKEVIKRYFSPDNFLHINAGFGFLTEKIKQSGFEYDLQIRDNYFNLYYRGNSMAKVSYSRKSDKDFPYSVWIHSKFVTESINTNKNFKRKMDRNYLIFRLSKDQLHSFFNTKNLSSMGKQIKGVNYKEEITFEQMLMTDNVGDDVNTSDFIIIDRQVVDKKSRTRMDLLALSKKEVNDYQFCVIEVKLGNNKELEGKVLEQLTGYLERINNHFEDYKTCYEINLEQKHKLGLIEKQPKVKIVPGVFGLIVVGGYSGIAKDPIEKLKDKLKPLSSADNVKLLHLKNIIRLEDAWSTTKL